MLANVGALFQHPPLASGEVSTAQEFHFGEYKLDKSQYRLQRGDRRLRLEKLPMELLLLLVERQGDLVSRDEIAAQLWEKDVFVDVDRGINTAVRKVRLALRDDPEHPRFVETIVGKGYRFAAPVICSGNGDSEKAAIAVGQDLPAPASANGFPAALPQAIRVVRPGKWVAALIALAALLVAGTAVWFERTDYFWRNPIANARFERITDFDASSEAAAVSRDGHFVAFLSDRDGKMDVWLTQVGSGQFHNLTRGSAKDLANSAVRNLAFMPDGSAVTFWQRAGATAADIDLWAVPTLGGEPRLYVQGGAELDWAHQGSRFAYHTPGPGDPLFVSTGLPAPGAQPVFKAPPGHHSHFPIWSPDDRYIYFVEGVLPDKMDIWRIKPGGGNPERITSQNAAIRYPIFFDRRTLLYLATEPDGSGPWLYSIDVEHRIPHRLGTELDRYTSLATTDDGRRLVLTLAAPTRTLWRTTIADSGEITAPVPIPLTTSTGFSPRLGANYLIYVSRTGQSESIWKQSAGVSTELWKSDGSRMIGAPAVSRDGHQIAFSVRQNGRATLYAMKEDGSQARIVTDVLDLEGSPAWTFDGHAILTAANQHGTPHLFRVPADGGSPSVLVSEYSTDPASSSDGSFIVYSGPDVGTTFPLRAIDPNGISHALPSLTMTRGARHLAFFRSGSTLVALRGEIQHKNLCLIDLPTGTERPLANFPAGFDVRDFDISPDGREMVLERVQEHSDIVLLDLKR